MASLLSITPIRQTRLGALNQFLGRKYITAKGTTSDKEQEQSPSCVI